MSVEQLLFKIVENALSVENQEFRPDGQPMFISRPILTNEKFAKLLKEIAANEPGVPLPPDFSRADIYDDHD